MQRIAESVLSRGTLRAKRGQDDRTDQLRTRAAVV